MNISVSVLDVDIFMKSGNYGLNILNFYNSGNGKDWSLLSASFNKLEGFHIEVCGIVLV